MLLLRYVALVCAIKCTIGLRFIRVVNKNSFPIWIQTASNSGQPPLRNSETVLINPSEEAIFDIEDSGWAGRLWAKFGCDDGGTNCEIGQSSAPCPINGCQPPSDTKVEFFFPPISAPNDAYYDISLVDGYSLASEIIPYRDNQPIQEGACVRTDCQLQLNSCPTNEISGLADLSVKGKNNNVVSCLAPCKKWNYPAPYGNAKNEQEGDGLMLCCPAGVSPEDCRKGIVTQTEYVKLLRNTCPSAYSYSYDDAGGLHNCPSSTSFVVNFYSPGQAVGGQLTPPTATGGQLPPPTATGGQLTPPTAPGETPMVGSVPTPSTQTPGAVPNGIPGVIPGYTPGVIPGVTPGIIPGVPPGVGRKGGPMPLQTSSAGRLVSPIGKLRSLLPKKTGSVPSPPTKATGGKVLPKKSGSVSSQPTKPTGGMGSYPDPSYYIDEPYLFGMFTKKKLVNSYDPNVVMAALPHTDPAISHIKDLKGFAAVAKTTGGQSGKKVNINTLEDLIKYVKDTTPRVLMINKDITAPKLTKVIMGSEKTIIGSPGNARLYNIYLSASKNSKDIIFQNLIFEHSPDNKGNDDIQLYLNYGTGYWIDHCSFVGHKWSDDDDSNDKLLYIGEKGSHATISNCFFGNHKNGLVFGSFADDPNIKSDTRVTIYDNHFENVGTGAPGLMRYGHYHVYNNYINNCNLGFMISKKAEVVSEYNHFDDTTKKNGNGMLDVKSDGKFSDTGSVPSINQKFILPKWKASTFYKYQAVKAANSTGFNLAAYQLKSKLNTSGAPQLNTSGTPQLNISGKMPLPSMQNPALIPPSMQPMSPSSFLSLK